MTAAAAAAAAAPVVATTLAVAAVVVTAVAHFITTEMGLALRLMLASTAQLLMQQGNHP
jgi:hypothetical protein